MNVIWPRVFTDPDFAYEDDEDAYPLALVDGHLGWALCHAGHDPPENFGQGMVKVGEITGSALPDKLHELSAKWLAERKGNR